MVRSVIAQRFGIFRLITFPETSIEPPQSTGAPRTISSARSHSSPFNFALPQSPTEVKPMGADWQLENGSVTGDRAFAGCSAPLAAACFRYTPEILCLVQEA
jgi:hypothetical protein